MTAPGPSGPPPYPVAPGPGGPPAPGVPPTPAEPQVPAPPAGPGVVPPFAAPPTEGRGARLWLGLGAGALAVLICCGGGGTAVVGLAVSNVQAVREQGRSVTDDYYRGLVERKYEQSYDALCDDAQRRESRQEFERRVAAEPQIDSYRVGDVDTVNLTVPVSVTFSGGDRGDQEVTLAPDEQTGAMEVCGVS
ncbi:hypothetical protein [Micromonospora sp. NPDC002575]|uniref:hypothetical protein n=1 Tax=Micromonospora sp. NPDC002575 TaxID=3364222 RepID=UPI003677D36A